MCVLGVQVDVYTREGCRSGSALGLVSVVVAFRVVVTLFVAAFWRDFWGTRGGEERSEGVA